MEISQLVLPSQFAIGTYSPVFDATAANEANYVSAEQQTFDRNGASNYTFFIPTYAPFYMDDLRVQVRNSANVFVDAVLGLDYVPALPFLGASRALNKPVYGAIMLINPQAQTTARMYYRSLGNPWVISQARITEFLESENRHPGTVSLEQAGNYQAMFPVITQAWDRQDGTRLSHVSEKLDEIVQRVAQRHAARDYSAGFSHVFNRNNAHNLTKAAVGLGNVQNLPPATDAQARDNTNDSTYVNTKQVNQLIRTWAPQATESQEGLAKLNLGNRAGDDSDTSAALTAAGFSAIVADPNSAISRSYNKGQVMAQVTPWPSVLPIIWNGEAYPSLQAFVQAVEQAVGTYPIEFDRLNGRFWFPANTTAPSLVLGSLPVEP